MAGTWVTETSYALGADVKGDDVTFSANDVYNCILAHISGSTTKPRTGALWATYWEPTGFVRMCNQCHLVYKPDSRIYKNPNTYCPRCGAKLREDIEGLEPGDLEEVDQSGSA